MRQLIILFLFLSLQACGQMTITPIMQGFTPSLVLDFTRGTLPVGLTFTRASIATRVNASGNIETVAADQPRFDYDPVTLQARGILIEEGRTNILPFSGDFSNAVWTKVNSTIATSSSTVLGATAYRLTESTDANVQHALNRAALAASGGQVYTSSLYARAGERSRLVVTVECTTSGVFGYQGVIFDLSTGTIIGNTTAIGTATVNSSSIVSIGGGWYRCSVIGTIPSGGTNVSTSYKITVPAAGTTTDPKYAGDGTSGIYVWGAQLEAGAFATSYIPTTSSSVTRASDVLSMPFGSWFNPTEGAWLAETNLVGSVFNNRRILGYSNSPNFLGTGATKAISETYSGSSAISMSGSLIETVRHAMSYSPAGRSVTREGLTPSTGTSTVAPVTGNLFIGQQGTGVSFINGGIRRIVYYPKRLPNTYLQSLTQ